MAKTRPGIVIGGLNGCERKTGTTAGGHRYAAASDAGFGYKGGAGGNEDRAVVSEDDDFFAVVDAMGGGLHGEKIAQGVAKLLAQTPRQMQIALKAAQAAIQQLPSGPNTGACLTTARILETDRGGKNLTSFHIGDTQRDIVRHRTLGQWLLRRQPTVLSSVTQNVADELIRLGTMTAKEARKSPYRGVVSNSLSAERCEPVHEVVPVGKKDRLLLYSDGVSENVSRAELITAATKLSVIDLLDWVWEQTERQMRHYDAIRAAGGDAKKDNRTFIAVDIA